MSGMRSIYRTPAGTALAMIAAACGGCGDDVSPEQQVRDVISAIEVAAEQRDVSDLMRHVSKNYRDGDGNGRDDASRYVRGYFVANQSIHLLTRVEEVQFLSSEEARANVVVGMVGREAAASGVWDLAADLYEFDVALLREGGEWKVTYARWNRK
jgi:hypothetical protein